METTESSRGTAGNGGGGRPKLAIAGLAFLAFVAGGGAGAAIVHELERPADAEAGHGKRPPREGHHRRGRDPVERMVKDLALTPEEEQKVRAVFEARRAAFEEVFERFRPEMDKVKGETRALVRAVLPPEKQEGFDRLMTEEDERRRRRPPPGEDRGDHRGGPSRHHEPKEKEGGGQ